MANPANAARTAGSRETRGAKATALSPAFFFLRQKPSFVAWLHTHRDQISHHVCGLLLRFHGRVRVGAECERRIAVTEHPTDRFDVRSILQCQRRECVTEIVQANRRQPLLSAKCPIWLRTI